jgi:hypothetical protein
MRSSVLVLAETTAEQFGGWAVLVIGLALALAAVVLFVAALVSIVRSDNYAAGGKALWALAVLAFPMLGAIFWFAWGRRSSFTTVAR